MMHTTNSGQTSLSVPLATHGSVISRKVRRRAGTALATTITALLLSACASAPPPPEWQASAFAALKSYTAAYLEGNSRVADFEFARARSEIARTGRLDLIAKIELTRCATQVASLVLEPCTGYLELAADALPPEQAYADFLAGRWTGLKPELLPVHYRPLVAAAQAKAAQHALTTSSKATVAASEPGASGTLSNNLGQIQDPLARLVAAGSLLKKEQLMPVDIGLAVDTASSQGWRRPLLAWLGVQHQRAQAAGDTATTTSLQRRMDLVLQTPAR